MEKRKYRTLQAYMEGTGTSARALLAKLRAETGHSISDGMFSYILRGSKRCSKYNALLLHVVTGIDMGDLTKWPKVQEQSKVSGKRLEPTLPNDKETSDVA